MAAGITSDQLADGVISVLSRTIILTDAQIKALPTTPIEIVPAPGADKIIDIQRIIISCAKPTGAAYANFNLDFVAYFSGGIQPDNFKSLLTQTGALLYLLIAPDPLDAAEVSNMEEVINSSISLMAANGDGNLTGGNAANTLNVTALYMIVNA